MNRLDTMQSQLIQFFDAKRSTAANRLNHTANAEQTNDNDFRIADELTLNSTLSNDTKAANLTIQNDNATNATVDGVIEMSNAPTTPITINDVQNMPNSGLRVARKRKRTANTVYLKFCYPKNFTENYHLPLKPCIYRSK